jgi:hypothetical protein
MWHTKYHVALHTKIASQERNWIMASVRSLDGALHFEPRGRGGFFKSVAVYWSALREGAAAAHEYESLTRQGATHEAAVAQVMKHHFDRR